MKLAILLSGGRVGPRGRVRRAEFDARATEMAMQWGGDAIGLHAGASHDQVLAPYAGMGLEQIHVVRLKEGADPLDALTFAVQHLEIDLVLAGARSELDCAQGTLPFALAARLGWPILPELAAFNVKETVIEGEQNLGRGWRRALRTELPAIVTVGSFGPRPRQVAFGRLQRFVPIFVEANFQESSAVPQARLLKSAAPPTRALNPVENFDMPMASASSLKHGPMSPEDGASTLLRLLANSGFLNPNSSTSPQDTTRNQK